MLVDQAIKAHTQLYKHTHTILIQHPHARTHTHTHNTHNTHTCTHTPQQYTTHKTMSCSTGYNHCTKGRHSVMIFIIYYSWAQNTWPTYKLNRWLLWRLWQGSPHMCFMWLPSCLWWNSWFSKPIKAMKEGTSWVGEIGLVKVVSTTDSHCSSPSPSAPPPLPCGPLLPQLVRAVSAVPTARSRGLGSMPANTVHTHTDTPWWARGCHTNWMTSSIF